MVTLQSRGCDGIPSNHPKSEPEFKKTTLLISVDLAKGEPPKLDPDLGNNMRTGRRRPTYFSALSCSMAVRCVHICN